MQKITLAKTAGFCFGVNRAVQMLEHMVENGEKACTLGPIIHNPQVISHFESHGVRVISEPNECDADETLVVRTHGVEKSVLEQIEKTGKPFQNATCPFVTKIHKIVRERSTEQNVTLIAGDSRHPEVVGIRSFCNGRSFVFNSYEEALNCYNAMNTKLARFCCCKSVVDSNVYPEYAPWLGDYTHPWTDEDLYKYFELTDDEIKIIEQSLIAQPQVAGVK